MSINGNLTYWSNYSNWPIIHLPEKTGIGCKIMIRLIASFFFFFQIQLINFDRDRKNLKNFFNEINYSKEGKVYLEKLHYIVQYLETIFFYCEKSNNTCWHLYIYLIVTLSSSKTIILSVQTYQLRVVGWKTGVSKEDNRWTMRRHSSNTVRNQ